MEAVVSKVALDAFAGGNLKIFERAFMDCGIGGRFSKFHLHQQGNWFRLINVDVLRDSKLGFVVHGLIYREDMEEIDSIQALEFGKQYPEWTTYLHTAQKVIAKIVRPGGPGNKYSTTTESPDSRYFVHPISRNLYIANRMYILEISPVIRPAQYISSNAVFAYLESVNSKPDENDTVEVFTEFDNVIIVVTNKQSGGKITEHTDLNPVTFEVMYGEVVNEVGSTGSSVHCDKAVSGTASQGWTPRVGSRDAGLGYC